jgi:hypothetical protein
MMMLIVIGFGLGVGLLLGSIGLPAILYVEVQAFSWLSFGLGALWIGLAAVTFSLRHYRRALRHLQGGCGCWLMTLYLHALFPQIGQTVVSRWLVSMLGIPV